MNITGNIPQEAPGQHVLNYWKMPWNGSGMPISKRDSEVKYWMLANETWVTEKNPYNYANDVVDFSKAMKAVDPSIMIVPNGIMPDLVGGCLHNFQGAY